METTLLAYQKALQNFTNTVDLLFRTDAQLDLAKARIVALEQENKELKEQLNGEQSTGA